MDCCHSRPIPSPRNQPLAALARSARLPVAGDKPDELYLNLVLEYVPETVYSVARQWQKSKQVLPVLQVKLYLYQLCRALSQIHGLGICHRDIKPQNLLLDPTAQIVKLCVPATPRVPYASFGHGSPWH